MVESARDCDATWISCHYVVGAFERLWTLYCFNFLILSAIGGAGSFANGRVALRVGVLPGFRYGRGTFSTPESRPAGRSILTPTPLFQKLDCLHVDVPHLDTGQEFYREKLGFKMIWRGETSAGLKLGDDGSELVLDT